MLRSSFFIHVLSNMQHCILFVCIVSAKHFLYPEHRDMSFRDSLNVIRPEHVAFGAGAASLLSHLALSLADAGDAVLIPAPVSSSC